MAEGRITGSEDVIRTLSERVTELSKRVTYLQAELEAAQKRVASYEEFDATLQEALSGALNAAHQIRERAETTASQILEQAREERRLLLTEIERLRDERDRLQEEIAEARRGGLRTIVPRAQPARDPVATQAELRLVATEALRGIFQELVDDLRRVIPPEPPPAPTYEVPMPPPPAPAYEALPPEPLYEAPRAEPEPEPVFEPAPEPVHEAPPPPTFGAPRREPAPTIGSEDLETEDIALEDLVADALPQEVAEEDKAAVVAPEPAAPPQAAEPEWVRPPFVEPQRAAPPAPGPPARPLLAPQRVSEPQRTAATRDEQQMVPPPRVVPPPEAVYRTAPPAYEAPPLIIPQRLEEGGEPITDVQLVLSPIASFPRLVEVERRIQSLPVVRSLYVREFRGGIATLAVGLRSAMALDEIASALGTLDRPRLRVRSGARNILEMLIDGEASIA